MTLVTVSLRSILDYSFLNNEVWRWASLMGVLLATMCAARIGSGLLQRQIKRMQDGHRLEWIRLILTSATGATRMIIFAGGFYLAQLTLVLDIGPSGPVTFGPIRDFWIKSATAVAAMGMAWFIFRLVDVVEHLLRRWMPGTETMLQEPLVALIRKTLRVFIIIAAGLFVAQNIFKWNMDGLLAGVAVGGLAFALAAQSSLANIFGCVMIFADRPFVLGERIKVHGYDGTVSEVNFRSTKIRTAEGHWITIPNSLMARDTVENVDRRPGIRKILNLALAHDTPATKVQRAVNILRELLAARTISFSPDQPPTVFFTDINRDSLAIAATFWYIPADGARYLEFCHELNMEILQRFNQEDIRFALPAQAVHIRENAAAAAEAPGEQPAVKPN